MQITKKKDREMNNCSKCPASFYDYSEGYEDCMLGRCEPCNLKLKTIKNRLNKHLDDEAKGYEKLVEMYEKDKDNANN